MYYKHIISMLMVKTLKQYWQNYREMRQLEKQIDREIDKDGIYKFVERHYGFSSTPSRVLKPKHV